MKKYIKKFMELFKSTDNKQIKINEESINESVKESQARKAKKSKGLTPKKKKKKV